ncbi:MAG: protein tyrosine phosphatase [Thalassobius sp.]|nr:protein tyrosine phosphatase [Thalassovita sp.]
MIKVLFVCLGNICRSPMAEGVFKKQVEDADLTDQIECDSAGIIGYHAGELPDKRMRRTASSHGITLTHHSRQLSPADFEKFDYILGMDENNMKAIRQMEKSVTNKKAKVFKMREFDEQESSKDVEDPYYQGDDGFEICYQVLRTSTQNFLDFIVEENS